ncbi:MAG TPA: SpoIIE family protein phosphatase [Streptosporangiaceae bacterium]
MRHGKPGTAGMVTGDVVRAMPPAPAAPDALRVLLIEDDDGDALLVEELLRDAAMPVTMDRARSLAGADALLDDAMCVLLDLGLPDSRGLQGVRWLQERAPLVAVVVLTGLADEHLGAEAVRAGAQDYLVKGQLADGSLLHRVIRYAIERRRAEEMHRQLQEARLIARENTRLERGLLPSPLLSDPALTVASQYRPGGGQSLLGGDFYDLVQARDGWVHILIGDVCGRGPDEAALGVCLRVAWRTMVLAGRPMPETIAAVEQVLEHERHEERLFTTMCVLSVAPDRWHGRLHLAGHPPPVLISPAGVRELTAPAYLPVGLGVTEQREGVDVDLGTDWSVLLYTDGLIEGRTGTGPERLGSDGLIGVITGLLPGLAEAGPGSRAERDELLLEALISQVREANGGELDDDLAVLAVGLQGTGQP